VVPSIQLMPRLWGPAAYKGRHEIAKELGVSPSTIHRWRERFEPELAGGAQVSRENVRRSNAVVANCWT
jgi:uncharacterized protein YjcR